MKELDSMTAYEEQKYFEKLEKELALENPDFPSIEECFKKANIKGCLSASQPHKNDFD